MTTLKPAYVAWALFAAATLSSILVERYAWMMEGYFFWLNVLGILSYCLAIVVLWCTGASLRAFAVVVVALVVTESWWLLMKWAHFAWAMHGFAP